MRTSFLFAIAIAFAITGRAQSAFPATDKSPLDICYYPANYPMLKIQDKTSDAPAARIVYSRPAKEGRQVFGNLVEYGKVWRLGANEATEIEFYKNVKIGGKAVPKGRYTLYAIVNENSWTFILNKDTDSWGAFKYDSKKDVARVDVPVQKLTAPVETLSMLFEKEADGCKLVVAWDTVKVALPLSF